MLPAAATPGSCRRNTNPYLSTSKYSIGNVPRPAPWPQYTAMMLDDLLDCDRCELDSCSSLQLQGIGPQKAGEENRQSRTKRLWHRSGEFMLQRSNSTPFKARIGKIIEAIYNFFNKMLKNYGFVMPLASEPRPYMAIYDQFFWSSWKCSFD